MANCLNIGSYCQHSLRNCTRIIATLVEKELPINGKLFNESKLLVVDRGIKTGDVKETFYHNEQGTHAD